MKKQTNEQKVLKALKDHGPMTQAELAKTTKVKNVYQLIANMVKSGKASKDGKAISIAVDETSNLDPKKVSEAIYKPNKIKQMAVLNYLEEEVDRLQKEIDRLDGITRTRLVELDYIRKHVSQLSVLVEMN